MLTKIGWKNLLTIYIKNAAFHHWFSVIVGLNTFKSVIV
jgi:hypothetical protein